MTGLEDLPFLGETGHVISLVGGGGKTTLLYALARHYSAQGQRVLVSTTTHIRRPDANCAPDEAARDALWQAGTYAVAGVPAEGGKLTMPPHLADWMAAHPDAVMARPGLCFPDGRPQSLPLRRCALRPMVYRQLPFLKFWEKYNRAYLMEGEDLSAPVEIEFCTGSFSAVRTAEFKAVGGFDEHYFMYVEDADLTQKMRTTGKAYLVPQYTAIHAWHRAAHRSLKPFLWQTGSLLRYFHKWGFKF